MEPLPAVSPSDPHCGCWTRSFQRGRYVFQNWTECVSNWSVLRGTFTNFWFAAELFYRQWLLTFLKIFFYGFEKTMNSFAIMHELFLVRFAKPYLCLASMHFEALHNHQHKSYSQKVENVAWSHCKWNRNLRLLVKVGLQLLVYVQTIAGWFFFFSVRWGEIKQCFCSTYRKCITMRPFWLVPCVQMTVMNPNTYQNKGTRLPFSGVCSVAWIEHQQESLPHVENKISLTLRSVRQLSHRIKLKPPWEWRTCLWRDPFCWEAFQRCRIKKN